MPPDPSQEATSGVRPSQVASAAAVASAGDPEGGTSPRVPDFFIVGHQKCGTTALYEMLKRHPQIFLPEVKEPRYFVPELLRPDRVLSTLDGYLALFANAAPGQLAGEASPQYIRSPTAAQAIAQMQPQARIVVVVREPASFLRSFHLQMVHSNIEPERDLRKALALVEERRQGRRLPRGCISPEPLMYFDHVRYVEQLERFHAAFSRERVLVLVYEDLRRDNRAAVRQILEFLEVDPGVAVEPVRTNPNRAVRSQALRRLADSARTARMHPEHATALGKLVNALTPRALHSEGFRARWRDVVYKTPPPPDPGLVRELRIRFRPEVEALSAYLGRDLIADWGYDRLD